MRARRSSYTARLDSLHLAGCGVAYTVSGMSKPRWIDQPDDRLDQPTYHRPPREPFPQQGEDADDVWDETLYSGFTPHAHQEFRDPNEDALETPGALFRRAQRTPGVRRWLLAALVAIVVGFAAYHLSRPAAPTREDVIDAILAAAEQQGRAVTDTQAACVVDELDVERIAYADVLAAGVVAPDTQRAFDNAFLRCVAN